jgi:hypothetical protein
MLVGHVCLQEVFVAELLVAQLAVGLNVEDLNAAARAGCRCESGLCFHHAVAVTTAAHRHAGKGKHKVRGHGELLRQLLLSWEERVTGSHSSRQAVLLLLMMVMFVWILQKLAAQDTQTAAHEQFPPLRLTRFGRHSAATAAFTAARGQVEWRVLYPVLFAGIRVAAEAGMLPHFTLFNLLFLAAVYCTLAAQADGFALLPPLLGGKSIERGSCPFTLKLPVIFFLSWNKKTVFRDQIKP